MKDSGKRWQCRECGSISLEVELLRAPNPFDETTTILGCPMCKGVYEFDEICDEPGCEEVATCGFPAGEEKGGYRRTCGKHYITHITR